MKCPVCGTIEETILVCRSCWFTAPVRDRMQFQAMHHARRDTKSKCEKIIRLIREANVKAAGTDKPAGGAS